VPQAAYVDALLADLDAELEAQPPTGSITAIFIGGGTPSLLAGAQLARLLDGIRARLVLASEVEITLEANPGAVDTRAFAAALDAGVNRLSLGVQSFHDASLRALGRVHDAHQARQAIAEARRVGCRNLNLDLMFGLPGQTLAQALMDLDTALAVEPEHLSYYQLTLEPGTAFAAQAPAHLPTEDQLADLAEQGQQQLAGQGYEHYEVSAHAQPGYACRHNLNYWTFGDYLGLGAGAHGKRTDVEPGRVMRRVKTTDPWPYLANVDAEVAELSDRQLRLEFVLNALRLRGGVSLDLFAARTGLTADQLVAPMAKAQRLGLMDEAPGRLRASEQGWRLLDSLLECFV
jgi:oxygen-independent coproporphyrinogen-3 oxidase